ncbi:DUF4157 domain-containing protein [Corallococcus terminator]
MRAPVNDGCVPLGRQRVPAARGHRLHARLAGLGARSDGRWRSPLAGRTIALGVPMSQDPAHSAPDLTVGGQPLPTGVRREMEAFFDADFTTVRIHEGRRAEALGAAAFACGEAIHFARDQFRPDTLPGIELLAHELTHVLQQRRGVSVERTSTGPALVCAPILEARANRRGRQARDWVELGRRPVDFQPVDASVPPELSRRGGAPQGPVIQTKVNFEGGDDKYQGTRFLDIDINTRIPSKVFNHIIRQAKNLAGTIYVGFASEHTPQAFGTAMYSARSAVTGKLTLGVLTEEQITAAGSEYYGLLAAMVHETQHAIDHLARNVIYNGKDEATLRAEWRAWAIEAAFVYEVQRLGKTVPFMKRDLPFSYRSKADFANKSSVAFGRTKQYLDYCDIIKKPNDIQTSTFIMQNQGWLHEAILMFYDLVDGGIGGAIWPGDHLSSTSTSDMEEVD